MFNLAKAQKIYIAVGYSDLRHGIDGFASIIQNTFHMNPQTNALFIFCGRRSDRIKALYWDTFFSTSGLKADSTSGQGQQMS